MTSQTTRSTTTDASSTEGQGMGMLGGLGTADVRAALDDLGRQLPELARASRSAADDLVRAVETGSEERVTAGVTLSLGLAVGMLLGGAPRLLVALVLAPVIAFALVLGDRRMRGSSRRASTAS